MTLRILVIGAGVTGGYVGGPLARASIEKTMAMDRAEGAVFAPSQAQDTLAILQGFPPTLFASMHHDLMAGRPTPA